jgi:hypothetical protein
MFKSKRFFLISILLCLPISAQATGDFSLGLLKYEGAMRIPLFNWGISRMAYANGTFAVSEDERSFYVVGHNHHQAIAEFEINEFLDRDYLDELPLALTNGQPFQEILTRAPSGNDQRLDKITGIGLVEGALVVNAAKWYDGAGDNNDTTLIFSDANDISGSDVTGFLKLQDRVHAAGWITKIPNRLQERLGGDLIFGYASNLSINSRSSMGPSAFVVDSKNLMSTETQGSVETRALMDFSVVNPLAEDRYNEGGNNDLWTEVSTAQTGFIVPGTNTYAVFGTSGGHASGIGYKITQDNGNLCGGPCPYESGDYYNYYWLFDVEDFISVTQGEMLPHQIRPYDYGVFDLPFDDWNGKVNTISGAYHHFESNSLYLMLGKVDDSQSRYETAPLMLKFQIETVSRPSSPTSITVE